MNGSDLDCADEVVHSMLRRPTWPWHHTDSSGYKLSSEVYFEFAGIEVPPALDLHFGLSNTIHSEVDTFRY